MPAYTSLRRSPAVNARHLLKRYQQDLSHFDAVHLVGHSLGGLVALHLLAHCPELPPGRLVTLGSPIQGSQVARHIEHYWPLSSPLLGHSLEQGLSGQDVPLGCSREWGMIAGDKPVGIGWVTGGFHGKANDGTVAVAETLTSAQTAHCILPVSHTGMLYSTAVFAAIAHFLRNGCFTDPV
ncbi:MAG: hypothetical protein R3E89_02420 [Thiolinea sp.]